MQPLIIFLLVILTFVLLFAVWIFIKKTFKGGFTTKEILYMRSHWMRIIDMFNGNPKGSILDADKLLDFALSKKGIKGTLGEKLKASSGRFSDINGVWAAHKLRNKIAHDLSDINISEARYALKHFKKALNDLGAGL